MPAFTPDELGAQAEWAAIQATPVPLENPALEAAAKIIEKWMTFDTAQEIRFEVNRDPESALEVLAEARRQTGAELAAKALKGQWNMMLTLHTMLDQRHPAFNFISDHLAPVSEALAAYERTAP
jgi:hypothetical protein